MNISGLFYFYPPLAPCLNFVQHYFESYSEDGLLLSREG